MICRLLLATVLLGGLGCRPESKPLPATEPATERAEPQAAVPDLQPEPVEAAEPIATPQPAPPAPVNKAAAAQPNAAVAPARPSKPSATRKKGTARTPKPKPKPKPKPAAKLGAPTSNKPTAPPKPTPVADKPLVPPVAKPAAQEFDQEYATLLASHVKRGRVDYSGLRANPNRLTAYADQLSTLTKATYSGWSSRRKLVFWINAYNALTVKLIVDQAAGKSSIQQIDKPWDNPKFVVMGQPRSLNDIEHKIIRKQWREPRVHMALVCAAKGCPILIGQPYTEAGLYRELARASRRYLGSRAGVQTDDSARTLKISKIFDWYGDDWVMPNSGQSKDAAVRAFISKYGSEALKNAANYPLSYLDYDWSLNGN